MEFPFEKDRIKRQWLRVKKRYKQHNLQLFKLIAIIPIFSDLQNSYSYVNSMIFAHEIGTFVQNTNNFAQTIIFSNVNSIQRARIFTILLARSGKLWSPALVCKDETSKATHFTLPVATADL